jgi:ribosomal protein S7
MSSLFQFLKRRFNNFFWYNFFFQIFFHYQYVLFGCLTFNGRKAFAFNFLLKVKSGLKLREHFDPFYVFLVAFFSLTPNIRLFPFKRSGLVHGVPVSISFNKKISFAVKWVIKFLKDKSRVVFVPKVVELLVLAIYSKGLSFKKKQDLYSVAFLNQHHLRFFK